MRDFIIPIAIGAAICADLSFFNIIGSYALAYYLYKADVTFLPIILIVLAANLIGKIINKIFHLFHHPEYEVVTTYSDGSKDYDDGSSLGILIGILVLPAIGIGISYLCKLPSIVIILLLICVGIVSLIFLIKYIRLVIDGSISPAKLISFTILFVIVGIASLIK